VVYGLLDLVGEVGARDVDVPVGVSDEDVGAEAVGPGLRPRVVRAEAKGRPHVGLAEIFSLAETGSAVFFAPASVARRYPRPGIAYRPVSDFPDSTLALAWPQDARSPAVAAFVRAACTVAAATHPQTEPAIQNAAT
jgi:hypothetical protein